MLTEVRSYSLALWLSSKGHEPIDTGFTPGGTLVFTFGSNASAEINTHNDAKAIFNGPEAKARAARMQGGDPA
jgi:streptogramin lyase